METTNKDFIEIRMYGFKELATLYFPDILPESASHQLKRYIKGDRMLLAELEKAGYRSGKRMLTPLQINILFKYIGRPELPLSPVRNRK